MKIDSPWLTLREAADYVRLSYSEARKLQAAGKFPGIKRGRGRTARVICNIAALDKWNKNGGRMKGGVNEESQLG